MKTKYVCLMITVLLSVMFPACTQAVPEASQTAPAKATTKVSEASAKPAWQQDWEKTLAEARQEGVVSISTVAGPGQLAAWRDGFMKAYGIQMEFTTGPGGDLTQKMLTERKAGLYLIDLYIGGVGSMFTLLKPAGAFDPIKPQLLLPEVLDPKLWYSGSIPFLDNEGEFMPAISLFPAADIVANSDLVKPEDIKTNKDLLDPRWKGKILLLDPTVGGGGRLWSGMVYIMLGPDFVRQFARQEPEVTRDFRQQVEWVARGKYQVLVGAEHQMIAEFLKVGAPMRQVVASDMLYAGSGMTPALINRAAHPKAAKVFLNWLLTKEGQTINTRAFLQQSSRLDVPTDHLSPQTVRQPGAVYMKSDAEDTVFRRAAAADEAAKILGLIR